MSKLQKGEEIRKCSQQGRGRERGRRSGKEMQATRKTKEGRKWKCGRVGLSNFEEKEISIAISKICLCRSWMFVSGAEKKESNFNIYNWNDAMNVKWVLDLGALKGVNPTTKQPPNDEKLT
jgi:hypothetical protein